MAFKSEAQREKFQQMLEQGKITKAVFDKHQAESVGLVLPDRVKPKAKSPKIPENKVWMAKVI